MNIYCRILISLLFLSLLPLSCMVVPKRELVNILFPSTTNLQSNLQKPSIVIPMDIEVNTPRGQLICFSTNSSREVLAYSEASFIAYVD